jgi:rare lipoprotein A (RlpA)-like double-psi beta-barrel protein
LRPKFPLRRMRSVHVIIATSMLAVPASAFAFTGVTSQTGQSAQNPVQTPIDLQVRPRRVKFGGAVTVRGSAPTAAAGRRVLLQTAPTGTAAWRPMAVATVTRTGEFRVRVKPHRSGTLRAVDPSSPPASTPVIGSGGPAAARSATPTVTVGARFTPARHASAVLSTRRVAVGGRLLPARPGRRVRLEGHTARGWRTLGAGRTGTRGRYRLTFSPGAAEGQRLRVLFAGDGGNARAVRPAGRVAVLHPALASWYDDSGTTACGFHAGLGVANRTLPCGTKVTFSYGGRSVTATVDDRGPFAGGRDWDLNQTTAAALGFAGVGTVYSSS